MASDFLRKLRRAPLTLTERLIGTVLQSRANAIDLEHVEAKPHGLCAELIVSLTSYPPRFKYLEPTLKCLLSQSVRADAVVLWLSYGDKEHLPASVLELEKYGLSIRECDNYRVYNKIIPSLLNHPGAYVVTADDDTYYRPTWLAELVAEVDPAKQEVVCHRAHKVHLDPDGKPLGYDSWTMNSSDTRPSQLTFPTGVGGVIYSPGVLHPDVTDVETFKELCPTADDIWLYWMGLRQGSIFRKIGPAREARSWPGTQQVALHRQNVLDNANDRQIGNLLQSFGFPATS